MRWYANDLRWIPARYAVFGVLIGYFAPIGAAVVAAILGGWAIFARNPKSGVLVQLALVLAIPAAIASFLRSGI
ncbi:MAG: hypothetical protein ABFR95_04155 [Actinomycetota bacterium]